MKAIRLEPHLLWVPKLKYEPTMPPEPGPGYDFGKCMMFELMLAKSLIKDDGSKGWFQISVFG